MIKLEVRFSIISFYSLKYPTEIR